MSLKFFTTSNSKYIIATLRIVTIEKPELSFLLILSFHAICSIFKGVQGKAQRNCKRKKKKKTAKFLSCKAFFSCAVYANIWKNLDKSLLPAYLPHMLFLPREFRNRYVKHFWLVILFTVSFNAEYDWRYCRGIFWSFTDITIFTKKSHHRCLKGS